MTTRRTAVLVPLAGALLLAGCGGSSTPQAAPTTATTSSPEPAPAQAAASAEAAAHPAAASDVNSAAVAIALRATDLPHGWSVQANPVPDGALAKNPSFAGICDATFASEAHRTAKHPVTGIDPQGNAAMASEAIGYDSPASAATALAELRSAFAGCSPGELAVLPSPRVEGLAADSVVVEYDLAGGTRQEVIAQARGAVVSVLIGEDETVAAGAARSIAVRMAALPTRAIGL
ncbi:MAG TPA: hypothetical protein VFH74_00045 [Gaiellales bacterium]|nr:hypothetical protein [Gaiellales bacterium]